MKAALSGAPHGNGISSMRAAGCAPSPELVAQWHRRVAAASGAARSSSGGRRRRWAAPPAGASGTRLSAAEPAWLVPCRPPAAPGHSLRDALGRRAGPRRADAVRPAVASRGAAGGTAGAAASPDAASAEAPGSSEVSPEEAARVMQALCLYVPRGRGGGVFGDGPAGLARLRPYRRKEVAAALRHGRPALADLSLRQLAGVASALAAAQHDDPPFMAALSDEAAQRLRAAGADCEWGPTCHLALACARLRVFHPALMEAVAAAATLALECGSVKFTTQRRASQLAALVGAFAALRLRPARLLSAVGETLKQQPSPLARLGPWESVVMAWALGRLERRTAGGPAEGRGDATLWTLVLDRAATQVGQLPRHDLCRAYALAAAGGAGYAPLLAALRRAVRERLNILKPRHLTAVVAALAALDHRDPLLTDELARWVHHKAVNFSSTEAALTLAGLAVLRYRNPWLLGRLSRVLASPGLGRLRAMAGPELAAVAAALAELRWPDAALLDAVGDEAVARLGGGGGSGGGGGGGLGGGGGGGGGGGAAADAASPGPAGCPAPVAGALAALSPDDLARLVTSLAALRHRHAALLAAACALAAGGPGAGSGWRPSDRAAVAWAAAVFGAAPSPLLLRAARDAAGDPPPLALDELVRLAWACAAHDVAAGTGQPDAGAGPPQGGPSAAVLAGLVPLLQQRLGALVRRSSSEGGGDGGGGVSAAAVAQQLLPVGRELPQLVEAARRLAGAELLPGPAEAAYAVAVAAALVQGPRGATLRQVAEELEGLLSERQGGAPPPGTLRLAYRLPGTVLLADVAVLPPRRGELAPSQAAGPAAAPLAVLLVDAGAAEAQDPATLLAPAAVQRALFAAVGWRVAYLRAEAWAAAGGGLDKKAKRAARRALVEELLTPAGV